MQKSEFKKNLVKTAGDVLGKAIAVVNDDGYLKIDLAESMIQVGSTVNARFLLSSVPANMFALKILERTRNKLTGEE